MAIEPNPYCIDVETPPSGTVTVSSSGAAVVFPADLVQALFSGRVALADLRPVIEALERERQQEEELTASMSAYRKKTTALTIRYSLPPSSRAMRRASRWRSIHRLTLTGSVRMLL
jgi:hypothetical protein